MRLLSLALVATVTVAGYSYGQTATQTPAAPPAASPPASSSSSGDDRLGHECKEEVKKQCGRAHGQEMQDCIKSAMDLNKFSADCKTKLQQQAAKPKS